MPRLTFINILGSDIPVGNADGYGKSFTIPAAGAVVDFTGMQLESCGPQLDIAKTKGWISWVKSENPNVSDDLEILAGSPSRSTIIPALVPAAKSATGVHAAIRGDTSIAAVTTGLTNPAIPRNASSTTGASWDGGNTVVVGTSQFNAAQTETIINVAGTTVYGAKIFKTVTSINHTVLGTDAGGTNTYSVGTGDKLGVAYNIVDATALLFVDGVAEAATVDITNDAYVATSVPNGTKSFVLVCSVNP